MNTLEVVARARSAVGHKTAYKLGKGGFWPNSALPAGQSGACDCSGFIAWCFKVSRHTNNPWYVEVNGGWFETSAIYRDCATAFGIFDAAAWPHAKPGNVLVWPDRRQEDGREIQGHIGLVSEIDAHGPAQVVHCSAGNFRQHGDAILETDATLFKNHGARVGICALAEPWHPPMVIPEGA